jgi:hypothetical protein
MYYYLYWPTNELFITSLYKIDCIITDRQEDSKTRELLEEAAGKGIPKVYTNFTDVFLKQASNVLPLY